MILTANDQELVSQLRAGDRTAFDRFFDRYADAVYALMVRRVGVEVAERLTENALERMIQQIDALSPNTSLDAWVASQCSVALASQPSAARAGLRPSLSA